MAKPRVSTLYGPASRSWPWARRTPWRRKSSPRTTSVSLPSPSKPTPLVFFLYLQSLTCFYQDGYDGLHGVHDECPHLTPTDAWKSAFEDAEGAATSPLFTPSRQPAHRDILRLLRENPPGTISILAVGPATNLALAAAEDPQAFLRAKELIVMGGTFDLPGNITPVAEFNTYADAVATARVFALTSPAPRSTMPPSSSASSLPPYPAGLPGKLDLILFPLDITTPHRLHRRQFADRTAGLVEAGSPLAEWTSHFMSRTFAKINSLSGQEGNAAADPGLQLHDPMTVWYVITRDDPRWEIRGPEDIRVETAGQWTRGMHVVDRRGFRKAMVDDGGLDGEESELVMDEMPGDTGGWLRVGGGNRVRRVVRSPGESVFGDVLLDSIFGPK